MRSLLLRPFFLALLLLSLASCNTASNMTHEVGSWFRTDKGRLVTTRNVETRPETRNADVEIPPAVPTQEVTRQPLDTSPGAPAAAMAARAVKVGLLLPLSGKNAGLGKNFQDAAQMALADLSADNFELIPKDSGDTPAAASAAASAALNDGAEVLIGPVFSESVAEVKTIVAGKVPVLSLSNDAHIAGGNTFVLGFSPAQQVTRALQYAAAKGLQNIAILAPSSIYGDMAVAAAGSMNGTITVVETQRYQNTKASIKAAVAAISARRGDIQAILLPDGGAALGNVAAELTNVALSAHDIPIIGTGLWDDQNVAQYNVLVGGFYAAPEPKTRMNFVNRYQKAYGVKPARLASLAYDATALVAVLAKQGQGFDEATLTNPNGFAGLDGIFRLNPDGVAERGLAILEVTASGPNVVEAAPKKF